MLVRELWLKLDAMMNNSDPAVTAQLVMLPCYACAGKRRTSLLARGLSICATCWGDADPIPYDDAFVQEYPQLLAEAQDRAMHMITRAVLSNTILVNSRAHYVGVCECCLVFGSYNNKVESSDICDLCISVATTRANIAISMLLILGEFTLTSIPDINKFIRLIFMHLLIFGKSSPR